MNRLHADEKVIEISDLRRNRIQNTSPSSDFSVSYDTPVSAGQSAEAVPASMHGGGSGGGGPMNERIARLEAIEVTNSRLLSEIKQEISNTNASIGNLERRVTDKIDENQKWIVALIISSILVPLLLALVAK
ncbi:hypothetical protein ACCC84_10195 [Serratia odorifera]|uniref:hypothetical protein n=1 Tax=Serratia odorifera TaxID=618 RepID=UPI003531BE4E